MISIPERHACLVCGAPAPPAPGLCGPCGAVLDRRHRRTVVLRGLETPTGCSPAMEGLIHWAGGRLNPAQVTALRAGQRPLVSVAGPVADQLAMDLTRAGVPAATETRRDTLARIPGPFYCVLAAVAVAGGAAGLLGATTVGLLTPLVAALLVTAAYRTLRDPVLDVGGGASGLPRVADARAVETLLQLREQGTARSLLANVLRMSRTLADAAALDPANRELLGDLLVQASGLARDLDRLDDALAVLDGLPAGGGAPPAAAVPPGSAPVTRRRLMDQLTRLLGSLGRAHHRLADAAGLSPDLARAARGLEADADLHARAAQEVERLLAGGSPAGA